MALHYVSYFQMLVSPVLHHREIDQLAIETLDKLRSRVVSVTPGYKLAHLVNVLPCNDLRDCHIFRDIPWHAELVQLEISVACDDRSGCEIATFSHQVAPESTFLALQTLFDSFKWLA